MIAFIIPAIAATFIGGTVAAAGVGALYMVVKDFQPGHKKIQADLKKMRAELQVWIDQLLPWNRDDLELISYSQEEQKIQKRIVQTAKGVFTSIYHEPLVPYAYKTYVSTKKNALLFACTSRHEFIYRMRGDKVELTVDNHLVGTIKEDHLLYTASSNRLLARINTQHNADLFPVIINDREVGSLINPAKAASVNPRAVDLVAQDITPEEECIFLALVILTMVKNGMTV